MKILRIKLSTTKEPETNSLIEEVDDFEDEDYYDAATAPPEMIDFPLSRQQEAEAAWAHIQAAVRLSNLGDPFGR